MIVHRARVFRMRAETGFPGYSRHPWRMECSCGEWQQGDRWGRVLRWTLGHVGLEERP